MILKKKQQQLVQYIKNVKGSMLREKVAIFANALITQL